MGDRRTRPLIGLLLVGFGLTVARLAQLQLVEHEVWAAEAARLERSGAVLPYERGSIVDAAGRVLVEDRAVYRLELTYRDFRRGHPLGIVAHARAALERRAVPLPEARARLEPWAAELVQLSPAALHRFARGQALAVGPTVLPPIDQPFREQRAVRASDLRYYARALLDPDRDERRALTKLERREDTERSYLELVADLRGLAPQVLLEERRRAWAHAMQGLSVLARRLELDALERGEAETDDDRPALDRLVDDLEAWRRSVEDAAAARLFRETLGFSVGRLDPELAARTLDLSWLADELRWEPARVRAWLAAERDDWRVGWRERFAVPRLLAELRVREDRPPTAARALSLLTAVFADPDGLAAALDGRERPWFAPGPLEVFEDLPRAFDLERADRVLVEVELPPPFADDDGHAVAAEGTPPAPGWAELVARIDGDLARAALERLVAAGAVRADTTVGDLGERWRASAPRSQARHRERGQVLAAALLDSLGRRVQAALAARLDRLVAAAGGPLRPAEERLERLGERARHLLRDYGSRRARLVDEPSYEVVYLLTRDPLRFPGLSARPERERRPLVRVGERGLPAAELIGNVSALDPERAQRQRADTFELARLRRRIDRTPEEDARLRTLMRTLLLSGEDRGVSGVEAVCDPWLSGNNGYRERLGLEDVYGRGAQSIYLTEPVDGEDVRLTIDSELQLAAQRVINEPRRPPAGVRTDEAWYRSPVGAIVLARPDGRILAAASAPDGAAAEAADRAGRERAPVFDRTLRTPSFQPLGSVFKPFVALHCLATGRVPVDFEHVCAPQPDDRLGVAGWGGVRCNNRWGHGRIGMAEALAVSCNSYFARLADELSAAEFERLGATFGLGRPTGVVFEGAPSPWALEFDPEPFRWNRAASLDRQLRRAANGLQVVEVTPVQTARAMAGLATGRLPAMRLVESLGDEAPPYPESEPLPYDRRSLEAVREMLVGVTNDRDGSAARTLSRARLGVAVAAKTGSADLEHRSRREADGGAGEPLKHTWVAGWLPAEDPELVFVVFLSATEVSSSYAAIYVAGQLLEDPTVRAAAGLEPLVGGSAGGAGR